MILKEITQSAQNACMNKVTTTLNDASKKPHVS